MLLSLVRFMFLYRIFHRGVPDFATDCLQLRRWVPWINHLPPVCWFTFWKLGAREHTCQMRLQCQWSPAAVMKASSFRLHIHFCLTRVAIIRWTGDILSWNCSLLFNTVLSTNILKHEGDILSRCDDNVSVEINWFRCVKKTVFTSFAKLLMCDVSPRAPVGL